MPCLSASNATAEFRRGVTSFTERRVRTAIFYFQEAERLGYDPDTCAAYRWQCWMLLGEFEEAWRQSDQIAARGVPDPNSLWDGSPFTGKRVVIRCLHGYGDAIQFLRYARLVRRTASRVIVETHPEMVTLLSRLPDVDWVTTWAEEGRLRREDWDQQIEVTELPRAFATTLETIPCEIPYMNVSEDAREQSCRRLGEPRKPKVGLLWASSAWNPARCMPFKKLFPLFRHSRDIAFYSFQRGNERSELAAAPASSGIRDTSFHSPEIADTAADLSNMDLLITVDTMAAHLAGALGVRVWTMLPWEADWRWMLDREDTPWYPTMRLFRQPSEGDWEPVVQRIADELPGCFD